ncbi:tail fiber domain-containing protein [Shewanella sp. VB17]|uniref:tail fiber domain-containing protein n=1 Tax=Shewanella sp. VB17 TaxID=2739432 RepID=UPI0015663F19|nr:tail fiber domain-containing protein [Shewanella sp. VB17]NRD73751.1 tail fiber domain-containing protein [Shewanella sp. VB17]
MTIKKITMLGFCFLTMFSVPVIADEPNDDECKINCPGDFDPWRSDKALKTNIRNIEHPMLSIKQIQGVKYEMKASGKTEFGFIAQDLQLVYPEMVMTDSGSGYLMVDYRAMIPTLLEAIKALETRISDLENR